MSKCCTSDKFNIGDKVYKYDRCSKRVFVVKAIIRRSSASGNQYLLETEDGESANRTYFADDCEDNEIVLHEAWLRLLKKPEYLK